MKYRNTLFIAIIISIILHIGLLFLFYISHTKSDKDKSSEPIEVSLIPKEEPKNDLRQEEKPFDDSVTDDEETTLDHNMIGGKQQGQDKNNITDKNIIKDTKEYESKDELFDLSGIFNTKEITDRIAKNKPPQKEGEDTASYNEFEEKYASYFSKFRRRVYQLWRYPQSSAQRGEQGIVKVSFSILKDGSVVNIRMIKSSGYPELDREVMRVLKNIGKIPLPKSYNLEQLNIDEANFIYSIDGSIIRYIN